jgi:hypothetical protein
MDTSTSTKTDYDFAVTTCCRADDTDKYGEVWLTDTSLNISPSPHTCHVEITTTEDAHKLIAAAQAFIAQRG